MRKRRYLLGLGLAGFACGGQVGEEKVVCAAIQETPVGLTELTPLGFTAMDVLGNIERQHTGPLTWADGGSATITLTVASDGTAAFVEREWVDDQQLELEFDCDDIVQLSTTIEIATDDGELVDSWVQVVDADDADSATFFRDLSDSLNVDAFVPEGEWDEVRTSIDLTLSAGEPTGTISGQVSESGQASDDEPDSTVSAQAFDVATIGTPTP